LESVLFIFNDDLEFAPNRIQFGVTSMESAQGGSSAKKAIADSIAVKSDVMSASLVSVDEAAAMRIIDPDPHKRRKKKRHKSEANVTSILNKNQ